MINFHQRLGHVIQNNRNGLTNYKVCSFLQIAHWREQRSLPLRQKSSCHCLLTTFDSWTLVASAQSLCAVWILRSFGGVSFSISEPEHKSPWDGVICDFFLPSLREIFHCAWHTPLLSIFMDTPKARKEAAIVWQGNTPHFHVLPLGQELRRIHLEDQRWPCSVGKCFPRSAAETER